jgi:hypothetical protein
MSHRLKSSALSLIALLAALGPRSALACAVCFGQSDSKLAVGMNMGILVLLLVIGSVLAVFASFFIFLARRSARFASPAAPASLTTPTK